MAGLCLGGAENLVSGCGGKISPGGMGGFLNVRSMGTVLKKEVNALQGICMRTRQALGTEAWTDALEQW